jgi:glycosyltransferase involved in cell wall biosynthesis
MTIGPDSLQREAQETAPPAPGARSVQGPFLPTPSGSGVRAPEARDDLAVPDLSVVVPCFNEEDVLPELYARIMKAAEDWPESYEIIAVDDGSTDSTWPMLCGFAERSSRWRLLQFARNFGHQAAVSAGLECTRGRAVVIIDADLQDPPELIPQMLEKWREGYQVVYGVRRKRKESALKRGFYSGYYRLLSALSSVDIPRDSGDFSLLDRTVVDRLCAMPERHRFLRGMRAWIGYQQIGLEYDRPARAAGTPKYDFRGLLKLGLTGIFSFSVMPLRIVTYFGLALSAFTFFGAGLYLMRRVFTDTPVPGFATLIIAVLFFSGVNLAALGITGEYVGRIYEEVKGRPTWIIRSTVGLSGTPPDEPAQ